MTVKELREALAAYPDDMEVAYYEMDDPDYSINIVYERNGRILLEP